MSAEEKLEKEEKKIESNLLSKYVPANRRNNAKQYLYADLLKMSEKLRCEISLEEDPLVMLEKSLICIAALTNDYVFYNQNHQKLDKLISNSQNRVSKENL